MNQLESFKMNHKEDPLAMLGQECDRLIQSKNESEITKQIEICNLALSNYSVNIEIGMVYYFIGNLRLILQLLHPNID